MTGIIGLTPPPFTPQIIVDVARSTSYTATSNSTLLFNSVTTNVNSQYNSSTGIFTADEDMRVHVYAQARRGDVPVVTSLYIAINNISGPLLISVANETPFASRELVLSSGETITTNILFAGQPNILILGSTAFSYMQILRLA